MQGRPTRRGNEGEIFIIAILGGKIIFAILGERNFCCILGGKKFEYMNDWVTFLAGNVHI